MSEDLRAGRNKLPPARPGCIWAFVDPGSAPHVAPHAKLFPGATLQASPCQGDAYTAANGTPIINKGQFDLDFVTKEGHHRTVTFQNGDVAFPILSTGLICDQGNEVTYNARGGRITCTATGEEDEFIRALGVYWIELQLPEHIQPQGFALQG